MIVLGIDPGITGGFAWVSDDDGIRQLLRVEPMPCVNISSGKSVRREVSPPQVIAMLHEFHRPDIAIIEEPVARPYFSRNKQTGEKEERRPGAMGMLSLGDNFGVLRTCCVAVGISVRRVSPRAWKQVMGLTFDKNESRRLAQEMFPGMAMHFALKKSEGKAEASLLAVWGLTNR